MRLSYLKAFCVYVCVFNTWIVNRVLGSKILWLFEKLVNGQFMHPLTGGHLYLLSQELRILPPQIVSILILGFTELLYRYFSKSSGFLFVCFPNISTLPLFSPSFQCVFHLNWLQKAYDMTNKRSY